MTKKIVPSLLTICLIVLLVLASLLFLYDIKIYSIKGRSMQPALPAGSIVLVSTLYYKIFGMQTGDLVIIKTATGDIALKRCFLKAGDSINYNDNSHYLRNSYGTQILLDDLAGDLENNATVPDNYYYFVGDNLNYSLDSRAYGLVAKEQVMGKVVAWRGR